MAAGFPDPFKYKELRSTTGWFLDPLERLWACEWCVLEVRAGGRTSSLSENMNDKGYDLETYSQSSSLLLLVRSSRKREELSR